MPSTMAGPSGAAAGIGTQGHLPSGEGAAAGSYLRSDSEAGPPIQAESDSARHTAADAACGDVALAVSLRAAAPGEGAGTLTSNAGTLTQEHLPSRVGALTQGHLLQVPRSRSIG